MKILAIRGKNLASLSSEFEIDFQSEPLASAGLYAITGATGAGKSTLLDALCLALYERTPRLTKATGKGESLPDVGDNSITPSDPRTLLRRGATEGFAEVDFVGSDGVAYRSRWNVRRSRNKAGGKLQNSEITLTRIHDGQVLGDHRKTETLRQIEALVGLNFDQFTRAVLLAQNDFAAFLKASDDERAELLQTLTGTETFSQISIQAFARMKSEKDKLEQLQTQLKDLVRLSPELRADKEQQRKLHADSVLALGEQKAVIEGHLRWHQHWDQLKAAEAQARQRLAAATAELFSAEPRHAHLALVEQVQVARPLWVEAQRLMGSVAAVEKTLAENQTALAAASLQVTTQTELHQTAKQRVLDAEATKTQAQPALDQAKALDASILTLLPRFEAAKKAQQDAQQHLQTQQSLQTEVDKKLAQARSDLSAIDTWLGEHVSLQPLSENWQLWETLFDQAKGHLAAKVKAAEEIQTLTTKSQVLTDSVAQAEAGLSVATSQSVSAAKKLLSLTQACASLNIDQLVQDKKTQEVRRDHLQTATQHWQKRLELQNQQAKLQGQQQLQLEMLAQSAQTLLEGGKAQPLLEQDHHSAEQSLSLAQLAASKGAEALRANLQADHPCPVCGSVDHPYAGDHSPVVDAMLQSLQCQVKDKRKALDELRQRLTAAHVNQTTAKKISEQLTSDLARLDTENQGLMASWNTHVLRFELDALVESERSQWLALQLELTKTHLAQLNQQEDAYRAQLQAKDAAQLALDLAKTAVDRAREVLNLTEREHSTTTESIRTAKAQLDQVTGQLDQLQAQLDGGFVGQAWRQSWHQDPAAFVDQCRENATAWSARQQQKVNLVRAIEASQIESHGCATACLQATQQLKLQSGQRAGAEADLQAYRDQRNTLFGGKPVAEVEVSFNDTIDAAKQTQAQVQTAWQQALADATRWQESVRQSGMQLGKDRASLARADAQLAAWLAAFNSQESPQGRAQAQELTLDALETLLEIPSEWHAAERDALQQLKLAVETAQAVLTARQQTLGQHESARATPEEASVLQQNLAQTVQELEAATEALSNLRLELSRDDDRLKASESLRLAIDQQSATAKVWAQLSDLIGSADGKKFRNFAQQYTLDILLGYGNSHLQSLTRRYRLQRIEDTLGLLVVDQDMGDEVRSVHSLSGGESFLVSLALALGLASLSSHRVKVESLFIDEGFGSLDADSLGVAMDALDNLQALGRKVGVISHVAEMTERIGIRVQVTRMAGGESRIIVG